MSTVPLFRNRRRAVLCTMHGKEVVIAPILRDGLGLDVEVTSGIDTDRFGTFTREIPRVGSQLEAARRKIEAAFMALPDAEVAIASEGSFSAHPQFPFVSQGREIVLMVDRAQQLELHGFDESIDTNHAHDVIDASGQALDFARRIGFPAHGVVVLGARDDAPASDLFAFKDASDDAALVAAAAHAIRLCGRAHLESDMRAHRNPTRMAAIERATRDLVQRFKRRCPRCNHPGFDNVECVSGLPCRACSFPTALPKAHVMRCSACGHSLVRPVWQARFAEPMQCGICNP